MRGLTGRVAVVTGGASGIGRACALALARRGLHVLAGDIHRERLAALEAEAAEAGLDLTGAVCDVTSVSDLEAVRDDALERYGRVDVVMNNVGVLVVGDPLAIGLDDWQRVIDVNLMSHVRSNAVFLPLLLAQGEGHLVVTASTNALYPYSADRLPYTATKAAVVAMAESLALHLRPRGVGVTCLCPGPVATNIVEQITFVGPPPAIQVPALEMRRPEEVAELVVEAIEQDHFFVLTNPEVQELLVRRATDPDAFLAGQIDEISGRS